MKKLILIAIIGLMALAANSQNMNKENLLLYTDTTIITGGDTLVRDVFAFLPVFKPIDTTYYFPYRRVYRLNSELLVNRSEHFEGKYNDTIAIGSNTYTLEEVYNLIKTINEANWQNGMWQIFIQKINNP